MGDESTTSEQENVACSFCNENYPSLIIGEHLMSCGNKTDQCPNCQKYIRRGIFAYHYENNFANLEGSVRQPESVTEMVANHNKHDLYSALPSATPTRVISGVRRSELDIMVCIFCNEECEVGEREIHEANCVKNPLDIEKRKLLNADRMTTHDHLRYDDNSNMSDLIPCEICGQSFPSSSVIQHTKWCLEKVQQQQQANRHETEDQTLNPPDGVCRHCFEKFPKYHLKFHEKICDFNRDPLFIMKYLKKDLTKSHSSQKRHSNQRDDVYY